MGRASAAQAAYFSCTLAAAPKSMRLSGCSAWRAEVAPSSMPADGAQVSPPPAVAGCGKASVGQPILALVVDGAKRA